VSKKNISQIRTESFLPLLINTPRGEPVASQGAAEGNLFRSHPLKGTLCRLHPPLLPPCCSLSRKGLRWSSIDREGDTVGHTAADTHRERSHPTEKRPGAWKAAGMAPAREGDRGHLAKGDYGVAAAAGVDRTLVVGEVVTFVRAGICSGPLSRISHLW